jgi:sugar/nucleoside kinase (ribokinase family)
MASLNVDILACQYRAMLGVGGIGSGAFFMLDGEHTLGREESRSGHFIDRRDYCKLHIISHYVKILLGEEFHTLPIGKVGDDEAGQHLLKEMEAAGLDLRYIQTIPGVQTMYSFCFLYPDGSGGNLTTDNSACDRVGVDDISQAEPDFACYRSSGIALAAPEVPLPARLKILQLGTKYGFWRVAAFNSAEMLPAMEMGLLAETDLLALNQDEAAAVAGIQSWSENAPLLPIVEAALVRLREINPGLLVMITAGKDGSWSWDGEHIQHVPAFLSKVVSTAGAGDAFLAGVITGKVAGLCLSEAQELGTLVAAHSVTSPHTIDPRIDRRSLHSFADGNKLTFSARVGQLLQDNQGE